MNRRAVIASAFAAAIASPAILSAEDEPDVATRDPAEPLLCSQCFSCRARFNDLIHAEEVD
jgi:hypothetical protein